MPEPVTELPASKAFGEDERSVLLGYLAYHRAVLARKVEGVSDADARRPAIPSSALTLLGLIRHMADVERWWFRRVQAGEDLPGLFDEDEEWRVPETAVVADALAVFWDEIAAADRVLNATDMDARTLGGPDAGRNSMRRIVVHMIEEYARHCGHADLIRESIDGAQGD